MAEERKKSLTCLTSFKQTFVSLRSTREEAQKLTELKWFTKEHILGDVVSEGALTYFSISHNCEGGHNMLSRVM